ncbi:Protein sidekick -like protein [Trichinella pseudospiralis]|uniref:Protein sidekick-like protein n=1 Tax=Trichinella pseudospiralis TaxID=6337 RepID=A0A0V1J4W2_TRIPS|nr:Protein sidekick -like protein [Trichinella pseudospiralis]
MQNREKKKKETVINLSNYIEKALRVKFQGGREITGILKGYDQLLNLVLDNTIEYLPDRQDMSRIGTETRNLGLTIARGSTVLVICPVDGTEQISNPLLRWRLFDDDRQRLPLVYRCHHAERKMTSFFSSFIVLIIIICLDFADGNLVNGSELLLLGPQLLSFEKRSLFVHQGAGFQLSCPVIEADQRLQIQWFKNRRLISPVGGVPVLNLRNASKFDAGSYFCKATDQNGGILSESTQIFVSYFNPPPAPGKLIEVRAKVGGYAIFKPPSIDAAPFYHLQWRWMFNNVLIAPSLRAFISSRGALVLLDVEPNDFGQYSLEVYHDTLKSSPVKYDYWLEQDASGDLFESNIFAGTVLIVWKPHDQVFVKSQWSDEVIFECVAYHGSLENLSIVWKFNQEIIDEQNLNYQLRNFRRQLVVRNPTEDQAGLYTCEASFSLFSTSQERATLKAPRLLSNLPNVTYASFGSDVDIHCSFAGQHNITWFYNGDDLTEPLECCSKTIGLEKLSSDVLRVKKLSRVQIGMYQCLAENSHGSAIDGTYVQGRTNAPHIEQLSNVTASVGQDVTLSCDALGWPKPTVQWYFNGIEVNGTNTGSGLLLLPKVEIKDAGWYTCVANNQYGVTDGRLYLNVQGKVKILKGPEDEAVVIGSSVVFPCQVTAEGTFTRQWFLKDQLLIPGAVRNVNFLPDGGLSIQEVAPINIGIYKCVVKSASGTVSQSGSLKIMEKPSMPLHVKAYVSNETLPAYVTLTWSQGFDGNSPIIKYVVEQRMVGSQGALSEWEVAVDNIVKEQHEIKIDNLKPSSVYDFRVIAVNRYGYGMPSVPSNRVSMPQQPPAAAPQNVAGSARSASDIMIQWQPPPADQWNGDILGYIVRYRLANYPDIPWNYHNISDSRTRNWLITDLITWREYEIQAAAFNERGMGVFSKSLYITTLEGVPTDAPLLTNVTVINSTAVFIKFNPPSQQMIPGVNLGYKVEAWLGEVGTKLAKSIKVLPYSLHAVEATMSGLEKYATYNITALCFTAPGDGPRSSPVQVTTDQDVPESVCDAKAEEIQFNFAEITWKPPEHPNGIILSKVICQIFNYFIVNSKKIFFKNYTLVYWSLNDTSLNETVQLSADVLRYKVQGLKPVTAYEVEIYASTAIGDGPRSKLVFQTTVPPEMPGPPSRLAISNPRQRDVTLQFTPGYDGKTLISRWIVEAMVGSSSTWQEVYNISDPHAKLITVSGLRPFTNYTLRLLAENVVGRSPPSVPSNPFTTLQAVPEFAPVDFDVQPISSTSVRATWNPLPKHAWNGPPLGYLLFYTRNDTATAAGGNVFGNSEFHTKEIVVKNPKSSEYVLKKLCKHCTYVFQLAAFNMIGRSELSRSLMITTYEDTPSGAPQAVKATPESPKSVVVTWQKIAEQQQNGHILGYRVEYRSVGSPTDIGHEVVNDESRLAVTLDGLRPYTDYRIKVAGITMVGIGVYSEPDLVIRTAEDVSEPPSEMFFPYVTTNEVRLTWKPPYRPNGIVQRYEVSYWQNMTGEHDGVKTMLASDLRMFVATGLFPMTLYTFSVAAMNSMGLGQRALASVYTSQDRSLPQSPTRPELALSKLQRSDAISVEWQNTANNARMPVRFYELEIQHENGDSWMEWDEKVAAEQATIDKLKPNAAYRFRVRSVNDHGRSPWSVVSDWMRTLEAAPTEPPREIEVLAFNATSVQVRWKAPERSTWNADVVGYRILYKPYSENSTLRVKEFPMHDAYKREWDFLLSNLKRFRHYVVQLQTFNQIGSSVASKPHFVYVAYSIPETAVTGLRAEPISSTEANVSWDPWPADASPINGFKVYYSKETFDNSTASEQDVVEPEASFKVLSGLSKFSNYKIDVVPFNRAGEGPQMQVTLRTLPDRPGPVQSLRFHDVLLDSVNISWTPPSEPNGIIIGYRVTYKTYKLDKEFMSQRQEKVIGRQYLVVTNLEENVTVSFSVEAETVVGYGPKVNGTVTIGPQPETLQAAPVDSFIVQYRGQNGAVPIRRRRMELLATESLLTKRWQTLAIIDSSASTYTVSYRQLKPGSTYTFRVVSRNKYGVSYPSAPSDPFTVPEGFSDRPFYLEWWFLVILALVLLVIVVIVVAVLWVTGNGKKCDHGRSGSDTSLQLSDGGIVTYQLRASKRNGSKVRKVPFGTSGHNNNCSRYTRYPTLANDEITFTKGSDMLGLKKRENAEEKSAYYNWYASVNNLDESHSSAKPTYTSAALLVDEPNMDPDVDSIAQHYQTTDSCYRETWRRAKNAAVHRPLSASGGEEDAYVIREEQLLSLDRNASLNRVPPTGCIYAYRTSLEASSWLVVCCVMMAVEESLLFASYRALGMVCDCDVPAAVRFLPQSKTVLLYTSVGRAVHTYRCSSMSLIAISQTLPSQVSSLAVGDPCERVYAGTVCGRILILRFGRHIEREMHHHKASIRHLLALGSHLISVDEQNQIVVSEVDSGEVYSTVPFDEKTFRVSAVCHPATYLNKLVFGSEQGTLRLFNVRTSRVVYEFQGWHSPVVVMQQSPVINVIAIGLANGQIFVHNLKTDQTLLTFRQNDGPVLALAFRLDGHQALVSASATGSLIVWNLDSARLAAVRKSAHRGSINTLIAIPDEPSMITVGNDNAIKTWIFDGGAFVSPRQMNVREGHSKPPNYIRFHGSDGTELLSASADGTLKIFNTVTEQRNMNLGYAGLVRRRVANRRGLDFDMLRLPPIVQFSSHVAREFDWDDVVCCHEKCSTVTTWSTRRARLGSHKLRDKRFKKMPLASATCCVISPCGNTALVGYSTGHVNVYNIQSGAARGSLVDSPDKTAHSLPLQGICVDAFNQIIVTGCSGGNLKLWNYRTRQCLHKETFVSGICKLVLNNDNNLVGIALDDLSLHLYDIFNRRTVRRFDNCHGNRITDLGFGPGGQWLVSSSLDCTIKVWDLASACLVDVLAFDDACRSFAISSNGQYLATVHCEQRGIYLWSNKTYYRPGIALRPLPADYEPATVFQLPGAACIDEVAIAEDEDEVFEQRLTLTSDNIEQQQELMEEDDDHGEQQDKENNIAEEEGAGRDDLQKRKQDQFASDNEGSRDLYSLCTFSGLSASRWANLSDLDLLRQRNKPKKQRLIKADKAPFFLKSTPGLVPRFDVEEEEKEEQEQEVVKSSRLLKTSDYKASTFADQLLSAEDDTAYFVAFEHLKSSNPASLYTELVNLGPESGAGSEQLLRAFLRMTIAVLKTGRCFELINAQLSLFLQLHHQYLWTKANDGQLKILLREVFDAQQTPWTRLDNLFSEIACMLDFVKASLI